MNILNNEFILFLSCAAKTKLKFLVVGGFAVNYYGYIRNTNDMDVWLEPTKENQQAFIQTLLCMNYTAEETAPLNNENFTQPFKATIGSGSSKIDLMTFFHPSITFEEAYMQKETSEIQKDIPAHFISYHLLVDMKLRAHRNKDLWDVARLDELRKLKGNQ